MKKRKILSVLLAVVMVLALIPAAIFASDVTVPAPNDSDNSSVVVVNDDDQISWYKAQNTAYDKLETYWENAVVAEPEGYSQNDADKTVTIDSAEDLVWWAKLVNDGTSFAGYIISITEDIDLSAHYWTPICANNVTNNGITTSNSGILNNCTFNGNSHRIIGLTTQTGIRDPKAGSVTGDGQNCYYYAGFIGTSDCNITMNDLTFDRASVAITEPRSKVETNGTSSIAVILGAQSGNGNLTLNHVNVTDSSAMGMQKVSAFIGNLMGGKLIANECEISNSKFSAYFMAAPIISYGSYKQVDINGIQLNNNTVEAVQMPGYEYKTDPITGANYWLDDRDNSVILNASTTMVTHDGSSEMGIGTELPLTAEFNGYLYPSIACAVEAITASSSKTGMVTLLKDAQGGGIGLFNTKGHTGVNLTIDFGGHTYTMIDPAAGSPGTETQAFHLEKGNQVILQNGTIQISESSTNGKMLIQNYCDLTVNNLSLIGSTVTQYIISSNYGDTVLNNVSISGNNPDLVAIDVMHWLGTSYADKAPTMVINNTDEHIIQGIIDVYCYNNGVTDACDKKPTLTINGGRYSANPGNCLPQNGAAVKETDGLYTVHRWTYIPEQEPTCTEEGFVAYYHCDICQKNYADESCTEELTEVIIPAKGHTYEDGVCTVCGHKIEVEAPVIDPEKPSDEIQVGVGTDSIAAVSDEVSEIINKVQNEEDVSSILSEEAYVAVADALTAGKEITAEIKVDTAIVPEESEKALIAEELKDIEAKVGQYLDLSVVLKADNAEVGTLKVLSKPIQFTIAIPESLISEGREYYIVRIHNGAAEKLKTTFNSENNTLTFETDKFSTYALAYADETSSSPSEDGDNGNVVWSALLFVSVCGLAATMYCRRRKNYNK